MKKILRIILIILFPLGIVYCVLNSLLGNKFTGFLGIIFACGIGVVLGIYLIEPQVLVGILNKIPFIDIGV